MNVFTPHDITLVSTDGVSFLFWKEILAEQSMYFKSKFSSNMKDAKDDIVNLEVSCDILKKVLSMCIIIAQNGIYRKLDCQMVISDLLSVYEFVDRYIFKKILMDVRLLLESCEIPFSIELYRFMRSSTFPLLDDSFLADKFVELYSYNIPIDIPFCHQLDENLWMKVLDGHHVTTILRFMFTEGTMTDEVREHLADKLHEIDIQEILDHMYDKIQEETAPKWMKIIKPKIVKSKPRNIYLENYQFGKFSGLRQDDN